MKHATTSITFTMQRSKLNVVSVIVITRPSDVSSTRCGATFCVQPLAFLGFVEILYSCLNLNWRFKMTEIFKLRLNSVHKSILFFEKIYILNEVILLKSIRIFGLTVWFIRMCLLLFKSQYEVENNQKKASLYSRTIIFPSDSIVMKIVYKRQLITRNTQNYSIDAL